MKKWPFDQVPEAACLTTIGILERKLPVLYVQHFVDDHSWAFTCGTTNESSDARVVSMKAIFDIDPSIVSVADLRPGWSARRQTIDGAWKKFEDAEDSDPKMDA